MACFARKLLSDSTGGMMLRVGLIILLVLASPLISVKASTMTGRTSPGEASRVVSLGGTVTEIVYALGEGHRIVANDASSLYPEEATRLPRVGYYRELSLEGILSFHPDLVIASENAGPPDVLKRLRDMKVSTVTVVDAPGIDSLLARVTAISRVLGVEEKGVALRKRIQDSLNAVHGEPLVEQRALVVLHRGGPLMAAGTHTSADSLLQLSGLRNAADAFRGYKSLSEEALVTLAPELIILTTSSLESAGGLSEFLQRPGVASTPAGRAGRVVAVDDLLLLGMGPRVAEAVTLLREAARAP